MRTPTLTPFLALLLLPGFMMPLRSAYAAYPVERDALVSRIAFGSCNRSTSPQTHWPVIANANPDLWIWMGDVVYGRDYDADHLQERFAAQYSDPAYTAFRNAHVIVGTWDDHDYGINNAHADHPYKADAQRWMLDFLDEPEASPRRKQDGIYTHYRFGPQGKDLRVILLDTRYLSTEPGPAGDLLGERQWSWLQEVFEEEPSALTIIVSSIQFLPIDQRYEKWVNYPVSRTRMLDLIREHGVPGVIFISGDRHLDEFSLLNDQTTNYPLYEVTSSGMTHFYDPKSEMNRYRVGQRHGGLSFGLIEVDWNRKPVQILLNIVNMDGVAVRSVPVSLDNLQVHKELE